MPRLEAARAGGTLSAGQRQREPGLINGGRCGWGGCQCACGSGSARRSGQSKPVVGGAYRAVRGEDRAP